jgi:hypothetical protein
VGEHNFPISLYLQTGGIGVLAFTVLVLGPYLWFRRRNRRLPASERTAGLIEEGAVISLYVVIFVLQNISGGFALGSMGTLFFITGALVAALAGREPKAA